ncbi:MAG: T9SS type A sorting domain-containing protein [Bacteroidia bacterium]
MKRIRLLLAISFLLLSFSANAQTFYKDSTVWYVFRYQPSISPGSSYFPSFYKEEIKLDSISALNEYYSVVRRPFTTTSHIEDSLTYQLRVSDSVIYFNGDIYVDFDSIQAFKNLKIFDFKLEKDDTIEIAIPGWWKCNYLIDSITFDPTGMPLSSKRYFFPQGRINSGPCNSSMSFSNQRISMSSIGFDTGLLPFRISGIGPAEELNLISACHKSELLYGDSVTYFYHGFTAFCDEDSVAALAERIVRDDIEETVVKKITVFPNPVSEKIHVKNLSQAQYEIFNVLGKRVRAGNYENEINVAELKPGIFVLKITRDGTDYFGRFIKQ